MFLSIGGQSDLAVAELRVREDAHHGLLQRVPDPFPEACQGHDPVRRRDAILLPSRRRGELARRHRQPAAAAHGAAPGRALRPERRAGWPREPRGREWLDGLARELEHVRALHRSLPGGVLSSVGRRQEAVAVERAGGLLLGGLFPLDAADGAGERGLSPLQLDALPDEAERA